MKVNLLGKFKWYIVGFILVAIMLSVSLSFCAWDTLSVKASIKASSGKYEAKYALVDDANNNKVADVGDIVTFGNYYQDIDRQGELLPKTPIRWIVVDVIGGVLTLYSEKIMAYGTFFGTSYYPEDGGIRVPGINNWENQNYSVSNVRYWLNSHTTARGDGGQSFSPTSKDRVTFRGFYAEAFDDEEKGRIVNRRIYDMAGNGLFADGIIAPVSKYAECNDKVWLPSCSEVFGKDTIVWTGGKSDGSPNEQFKYFKDSNSRNAQRTAFSSSKHSNYTMPIVVHSANFQNNAYWLRSPYYANVGSSVVNSANFVYRSTADSYNGVRPAICIPVK